MASRPESLAAGTIVISAAATAPSGVQVSGNGLGVYMLTNTGTTTAFMAAGASASAAQSAAVIPTGTTGERVWPVLAGAAITVTDLPDAYWSGITASGTASVYVSPLGS